MGLEVAPYVGALNAANPLALDPESQGANHLRLIKSALLASFPGLAGLIMAWGTEAQGATVNAYVVTITPAPTAYTAGEVVSFVATHTNTTAATLAFPGLAAMALSGANGDLGPGAITNGALVTVIFDGTIFRLVSANDRGHRTGETWTGTHDFTNGTIEVATFAPGASGAAAASLDFVNKSQQAQVFPGQSGNQGRFITTLDGDDTLGFADPLPVQSAQTTRQALRSNGTPETGGYWDWPGGLNAFFLNANSNLNATHAEAFIYLFGTCTDVYLPAQASVQGKFSVRIYNYTGAAVTLHAQPNETVEGQQTIPMAPNEGRFVVADGGTFYHTAVVQPYSLTATSSQVVSVGPGYSRHVGLLWGGGSGGASSGGGGGGACVPFDIPAGTFGTSQAITIGGGGSGLPSGQTGNPGGASSIGGLVTAYGGGPNRGAGAGGGGCFGPGMGDASGNGFGQGGLGGGGFGGGTAPGTPMSPSGTYPGGSQNSGYGGGAGGGASGYGGGFSTYGGGGGGGIDGQGNPQGAGASMFGGSGGAPSLSGDGSSGATPGGGGGGCSSGHNTGAGARGECRIRGVV